MTAPTTFGQAAEPFHAKGWAVPEMVPLVPHRAELLASSMLKADWLGKVPGRYHGDGKWTGQRQWQTRPTPAQFRAWQAWPTPNIGVRAEYLQAIDLDLAGAHLVSLALVVLAGVVGRSDIHVRGRSASTRCAIPVRGIAGLKLPQLEVFDAEGASQGKVEVKTSGQWVITGQHPAGDDYVWPQGIPAWPDIPELNEEQVRAFREGLVRSYELQGLQVVEGKRKAAQDRSSAGTAGARREADALPQLLTLQTLEELLEAVPCTPETVGGWDEGVKVLAGFRAVLGPAGWPEPPPCLHAWSSSYPGTTDDWFEARWKSLGQVDQGATGFIAWLRGLQLEEAALEVVRRAIREVQQAEARSEFEDEPDQAGEPEDAPAPEETPAGAQAELDQLIAESRAAFVYRQGADEWIRLDGMTFMSAQAFSQTDEGLALSAAWARLERSRQGRKGRPAKPLPGAQVLRPSVPVVHDVTYEPGSPPIINRATRRLLNKWRPLPRPYAGQVITEADIAPFLAALAWVFPDPVARTLFLDWASHLAQHPGIKVEWMPVLFSLIQGTGKDTVLRAVWLGVVGPDNWSVVQLHDLTSTNNGGWAESQVVLVMELPGGAQRDAMALLKGQIASVAGFRMVNPKYVRPYNIADRISWASTTNKPDAIDLTDDDRRAAVLGTREARMPPEIAEAVHAFYDADGAGRGLALVGEYLHQRTISAAFNAKRCPPSSEAKERMRRHGLDGTPAERLLDRLLEPDAPGSLAQRRLLWGREVQAVLDGAANEARWRGRRGHLAVAMEAAGWRHHPAARDDGRIVVAGPRGVGEKRAHLAVGVWVRAGDAVVLGADPRQVLELLHDDLRTHDSDLSETLGQLLATVNDPGDDDGPDAPIDLAAKRKQRAARKPAWL